ncbi:MAG: molybdate ABC transporter substrate-binding protein [Planctomycetes bacterium]|nr:molybdate ABC transporter substrate-binding protein [Planctomycetota bacterium]
MTLEQLAVAYETLTSHKIVIISASSGILFTQINHGAPFDVFLSADARRPAILAKKNQTETFVYAIGQLAFWSPKQTGIDRRSLIAFEGNLALANPRIAPYGIAAMESLRNLKPGHKKLVHGMNVNQAFQFVDSGNAGAGLVALSQRTNLPTTNYWLIPENLYAPIEQHGILLSRENPDAIEFVDYLQSPTARALIAKSGYRLP